jgi:RNA polymerase sigma-70 factor (ECF subfamily)
MGNEQRQVNMADPLPIEDEARLVERLQADDLDALGELYEHYHHQVYRTAFAITRDSAAAEDILQETFLRLYAYADRIDTSLPLGPWLYRITVNLSYSWHTGCKRHRVMVDKMIRLMVTPRPRTEATIERNELLAKLQDAIDKLSVDQRVVIVLHYLNDMSVNEIAGILECPVGTVKSRLYYARVALRAHLGGQMPLADVARGYT